MRLCDAKSLSNLGLIELFSLHPLNELSHGLGGYAFSAYPVNHSLPAVTILLLDGNTFQHFMRFLHVHAFLTLTCETYRITFQPIGTAEPASLGNNHETESIHHP